MGLARGGISALCVDDMSKTVQRQHRRHHVESPAKASSETPAAVAPPAQFAGVARAAAHLDVDRIRFVDLRVSTGYSAFEELPSKIKSKIGFTKPTVEIDEQRVRVITTFLLRITGVDAPAQAPPAFELRAKTELVYRLTVKPDQVNPADIDEFARVNAPFNAWPYWREIVRSALARLDLPGFLLPLFRVADAARLMLSDDDDMKNN
jgi:hypothetical protein